MTDKTYSVTELKTFIEAVEFAADVEEWIPSARQWKRIREMIDHLQATAAPEPAPAFRYQPNPQPPMMQGPVHSMMPAVPAGPSAMSGLSAPQNIGQPNAPLAYNERQAVRTPDIDNSNGVPYKSSFA